MIKKWIARAGYGFGLVVLWAVILAVGHALVALLGYSLRDYQETRGFWADFGAGAFAITITLLSASALAYSGWFLCVAWAWCKKNKD